MAWNVSRWPGRFLDGVESFQIAWKVSRLSGNFLYLTKNFQVYKNFPGSIATLLPWFFRLWPTVSPIVRPTLMLCAPPPPSCCLCSSSSFFLPHTQSIPKLFFNLTEIDFYLWLSLWHTIKICKQANKPVVVAVARISSPRSPRTPHST